MLLFHSQMRAGFHECLQTTEGTGDVFPIQLVVTSRLSKENNFWLKNLTDDLTDAEAVQELAREYQDHRENTLYRSVMNIIIKANEELFKEESGVCEAIIDLFRDEYDKGVADAKQLGVQQGALQQLITLVKDNLLPLDVAVQRSGISEGEFKEMMEK